MRHSSNGHANRTELHISPQLSLVPRPPHVVWVWGQPHLSLIPRPSHVVWVWGQPHLKPRTQAIPCGLGMRSAPPQLVSCPFQEWLSPPQFSGWRHTPALCSLRQSGVQLGLSESLVLQKGTGGEGRGRWRGRERRGEGRRGEGEEKEGRRGTEEGKGSRGEERKRTDRRRKLRFTFASCTHYLYLSVLQFQNLSPYGLKSQHSGSPLPLK